MQTGWHGIDVRVSSVSGYLPSLEDNNAPFLGTTNGKTQMAPALTPAEDAAARIKQAEVQRVDAEKRRVVWGAEDGHTDADADADDDPVGGMVSFEHGLLEAHRDSDSEQVLGSWKIGQLGLEYVEPIGLRDPEGKIIPLPKEAGKKCTTLQENHYVGAPENVPSRVGQLVSYTCTERSNSILTSLITVSTSAAT